MSDDRLAQFANEKYLNLETYRKNGTPVDTPVWFALEGDTFYAYSRADAGKVKRIRNNPNVRITPCDVRGKVKGRWIDAKARIVDGAEAAHGQELLTKKYGWLKRIGGFFSKLRDKKQDVLAIRPA